MEINSSSSACVTCCAILWGDMQPRLFYSLVYLWNRRHHSYSENIKKKNLPGSTQLFHCSPSLQSMSCTLTPASRPHSYTRVIFSAWMFHQDALWGCCGCLPKLHFSCLWWDFKCWLSLVSLFLISFIMQGFKAFFHVQWSSTAVLQGSFQTQQQQQ